MSPWIICQRNDAQQTQLMRFGQTSKHLQILIQLLNKHEKSLFPVFTSVDYHLSWYTDSRPDHTNYLTCWCLLLTQRTAEGQKWREGVFILSHSFNWVWSSSFFFIRLLPTQLDIFGPKVESEFQNGSYGSCNVNTDQMLINFCSHRGCWNDIYIIEVLTLSAQTVERCFASALEGLPH